MLSVDYKSNWVVDSVNYTKLIVPTIKELQNLEKRVKLLENMLKSHKNKESL